MYTISLTFLTLAVVLGVYLAKSYQLLNFAKNSETEELMVVYRTLYVAMEHWVRRVMKKGK